MIGHYLRSALAKFQKSPFTTGATMTLLTIVLAGFVLAPLSALAQEADGELPRRSFFGVALGEAADGGGVEVTSILPGSTAADIGIFAGDAIRAVDGATMYTVQDVIGAMASHPAGEIVSLDIVRDDETLHFEAVLKPMPFEHVPASCTEYGFVRSDGGARLRTILSEPVGADEPAPAVMLLQGGGCGSIDTPIGVPIGQPALLHDFAAAGFITFRVEKSGVGDSEGPSCAEIGYFEELSGYRAALAALRTHPAVDPNRIFLAGVSLGGVFAPILANDTPVAGIVTYATINFAPEGYPGRSERFFREIQDNVDVLAEWARVDVPVLVLFGEFDEGVRAEWNISIADAINAAHPGLAEHRELAGLDHCGTRHASMADSIGNCGRGEPATQLSDAMLGFLREHS